jgi:SRSO17 transposase
MKSRSPPSRRSPSKWWLRRWTRAFPVRGVLGDAVFGSDKTLRVSLEERDKPYVLAVRGNEKLTMGDFHTYTAEQLAADLAPHEWQRLPAGVGSKGPRLYDWARLRLFRLQSPPWDHWLLVRRSIFDPADMAFYVTFAPDTTELKELAAVAGLRWTIEECFQSAKGETGLDHCEARSWHGWHRHMTLSMMSVSTTECVGNDRYLSTRKGPTTMAGPVDYDDSVGLPPIADR